MCTALLPPGDNPIAFNKYIITYTLHEDLCIFMTHWPVLLTMTYISDKRGRVNHNRFYIQQLLSENRTDCEITWGKKMAESDWPQMIMRRKRIIRWITKARDTHSAYVIINEYSQQ
jgi:hypothetical protein